MTLIGPYPDVDLPVDARPAARLDGHTLADASAREDALLGALAQRSAAEQAAQMAADPDARTPTTREVRAMERAWAAHWRGWAETPHDVDDRVDYARIVACSLDRAEGSGNNREA